jgi:heat-inducible transcriptional repressor
MLSPRTATILNSIVGQYIARATPVPSRSIINDYELAVSPATIRNEMAHLEREGYIIRLHPSAGSIPSDKGYRYYVESLNDVELPLAEQRLISHLFHQVEMDLDEWLMLAAALTAQMVQNVAVITMPKPADCQFQTLELVALQDSLALFVLILHGARVRQQLVTFDQAVSQPQLTVIANKLNAAYCGLNSSQISDKDIELSPVEQQVTDSVVNIMQAEDEQDYEELCLNGWHFMLNQPEFAHSHQMSPLMELVENRSLLRTILPHEPTSQGVQVIIGKENKAEVIHNYSVVINRYGLPDEAIGTISVLGPTRMPYARTISTINYLSSVLSGLVAELYRK